MGDLCSSLLCVQCGSVDYSIGTKVIASVWMIHSQYKGLVLMWQ